MGLEGALDGDEGDLERCHSGYELDQSVCDGLWHKGHYNVKRADARASR